jgi:hypothetical protein
MVGEGGSKSDLEEFLGKKADFGGGENSFLSGR